MKLLIKLLSINKLYNRIVLQNFRMNKKKLKLLISREVYLPIEEKPISISRMSAAL